MSKTKSIPIYKITISGNYSKIKVSFFNTEGNNQFNTTVIYRNTFDSLFLTLLEIFKQYDFFKSDFSENTIEISRVLYFYQQDRIEQIKEN